MINLACSISYCRIFLAFVTVWCIYHALFYQALISFVLAAFSDVLDGWVARVCNQQTKFGQILDPVADKIFAMSVMIALLIKQQSTLLFLVLLFLLLKEFLLLSFGAWLWFVRHRFISPSKLSRFVSFAEFCLMFVLLLQQVIFVPYYLIMFFVVCNVVCSVLLLVFYANKIGNF